MLRIKSAVHPLHVVPALLRAGGDGLLLPQSIGQPGRAVEHCPGITVLLQLSRLVFLHGNQISKLNSSMVLLKHLITFLMVALDFLL